MENHPVLCKCHVYPNSDLSLWLSWLKLIDSRLQSWAEPPLSLSCDISSAQLFLAQLDWLSCFELSCGNTNSEVLTGSELTAHKSMHRDDYNLWHWRLGQHFSHPFLGTYEVVQFFELGNLKGTHSGVMYGPHANSMVPWYGTPIPYPSHSNTKSPHTNTKPYHHSKPVTGCLGSFLQNMQILSASCNTGPLGSIFFGQVLQVFADILSNQWRLYIKLHPLKISFIGLYPRFCCV